MDGYSKNSTVPDGSPPEFAVTVTVQVVVYAPDPVTVTDVWPQSRTVVVEWFPVDVGTGVAVGSVTAVEVGRGVPGVPDRVGGVAGNVPKASGVGASRGPRDV